MDLHRTRVLHKIDPPSGKPCEFCKRFDPEFERRNPIDQLVGAPGNHSAPSHLTEDGHIKHLLAELKKRLDAFPFSPGASAA
jgi:hypothetical protein